MELKPHSLKIFTAKNWYAEIVLCHRPVLVDFIAPWCRASVLQGDNLQQLAKDCGSHANVGVLDASEDVGVAVNYRFHDLPTMGFFCQGKLVKFFTGAGRLEE
jgi:thioredoxin 1